MTKHHSAAVGTRYRLRSRHLNSRAADIPSWRFSGAITLYPAGSRHVSTGRPPIAESITKDVPQPVPNATARKPKVDLRPAPVKPPKTSFNTTADPKHASSVATDPTPKSSQTLSSSTSAVDAKHSVIDTAKEDYSDASKHGILTPPPEGASWPRRLFHQAKELFVRNPNLCRAH